MDILKEFLEYYKKKKVEERMKRKLVKSPFDYGYLQGLINLAAGSERRVIISIHLPDGTKFEIKEDKKPEKNVSDPYETIK